MPILVGKAGKSTRSQPDFVVRVEIDDRVAVGQAELVEEERVLTALAVEIVVAEAADDLVAFASEVIVGSP